MSVSCAEKLSYPRWTPVIDLPSAVTTVIVKYPAVRSAEGDITDSRRYARLRVRPARDRSGPRCPPRVPTTWHFPHPPLPQNSFSPAAAEPLGGVRSAPEMERI